MLARNSYRMFGNSLLRNFAHAPDIRGVRGREVIDSRGNPTVEAEVVTDGGVFRSIVPSGASTGIYEAHELRDGDKGRFGGKGVLTAVENINTKIREALVGRDVTAQTELDTLLVEQLDGSNNQYGWNKKNLGANAVLAVSLSLARAAAVQKQMPLYQYLAELAGTQRDKYVLPVPCFNVINGGEHAGNQIAFQEFMILPVGAPSFREGLRYGAEVYQTLKGLIKQRYGQDAVNVGDEGGFAPDIDTAEECLQLLVDAIEAAGHTGKVKIGLDVAASEFYRDGKYDLRFKSKTPQLVTVEELAQKFVELCDKYPIVSIEDPFDQDDWEAYTHLMEKLGDRVSFFL